MKETEANFSMPVETWFKVDRHLHNNNINWKEEDTEQWLFDEYGFSHVECYEYMSKNPENISLFLLRWR